MIQILNKTGYKPSSEEPICLKKQIELIKQIFPNAKVVATKILKK